MYRFSYYKVYDSVPDNIIVLFNNSDDSDEDRARTLEKLVRKNKRRRRRLLRAVKKLNVSFKNERVSVKKTSTNPQETAKQGVPDQKKVIDSLFTGVDSLHMFCEDL